MATAQLQQNDTSEAAIFARVWESPENGLTPELAQHVLKLGFSEKDKSRMHELAAKNQQESLSVNEAEELDNYIKVADLLAIVQSEARKFLKRSSATIKPHG